MKYRFFILGLAAILFAACVVNEEDHSTPAIDTEEEFYASIEGAATRVFVDDELRVLWNADDRVSIFNRTTYNRQYRFDGVDGDNSGTFKKVPTDDFVTSNPLDYVYSVYPYNENTKISNDGILTVYLPAEQSYREETFGLGANTMIAVADDNELMFKNLCGYIMLKLYGDNVAVTSISLKGNNNEPLAGKATVVAAIGADPTLSLDASATGEITLTCPTPVTLGTTTETATTFWLVVPPTTFESGITITVNTSDGAVFEKRTTGSLAISRNTRSKMAALEVVPEYPGPSRYLTFTSEGTTTLSLTNYNDNAPVLYYSFDKTNWTLWDYSELTFTGDQPLYLCGDNPEGFSSSYEKYSKIVTAGNNFSVSGDIMSLIDSEHALTTIPCDYCFHKLFMDCAGLTTAPDLPATTLAAGCYTQLFANCPTMTTAPELPATTLAIACYNSIFSRCISLTTAPALPATMLASSCYYSMFNGCSGLTTAPNLPATTLAASCYHGMFSGCSGLTIAPNLPATTLAAGCYDSMFSSCTSLTTAPELPATTLAEQCYRFMFSGCTSLTTAPELPATEMTSRCYFQMFGLCKSLENAPNLPATTLAEQCYRSMFYGCTSLAIAPELPATMLAERCYLRMFEGCTSLTATPELPATALAPYSYYYMFYGCSQLNYVKCLATDISAENCTAQWLEGVASTGTFVKAPGMNDWPQGASGIPERWTVESCPEAVDLGLPSGIKWASFNLGASSPEEYGDYYAWGETEPYYSSQDPLTWKEGKEAGYDWVSYKWCMGSNNTLTKYCTDSSYGYNGFTDGKTVLDLEDDAAHVALGGKWRMPTDSEWTELREYCTLTKTSNYNGTGVAGRIVTSNVEGYKEKSIFLPATGYRYNTSLSNAGNAGNYWSSSLYTGYLAWAVYFGSGDVYRKDGTRGYGRSVRPVYCEDLAVTGGDTPAGDYSSNVTFTAGTSSQLGKIKVNGGETEYDCLKMGTSTKIGEGTVTLPAGTSKVSFYAIGWNSTGTTLVAEIGGNSQEVAVAANSTVSGNSPWNVTVSASDYHTISLGAPLAAETVANVSTVNNAGTRCILFGIKAE